MKTFITLIFIGAILMLGLMASRGTPPVASTTLSPSNNPVVVAASGTPPAQGGGGPTGQLFALSQSGKDLEIVSIDVVTKAKKVVFSDKGSTKKIELASNVTSSGDTIVLLLAPPDDPAGQLVALKTDGSGVKTILKENFVTTQPPAISPDRTKLALVRFSNAEPNYGFTLVTTNVDGTNKKNLVTDESGISHLAFSPDGKRIAFIKGAAGSSEIDAVTVDTAKAEKLYSANEQIVQDFDWSAVGPLVYSAVSSSLKNQTSEVYALDTETKKVIQVTKNNQSERTPKVAPDATGLAYIQGASDPRQSGDIIVTFPDGSQAITIGVGLQLLGWTK